MTPDDLDDGGPRPATVDVLTPESAPEPIPELAPESAPEETPVQTLESALVEDLGPSPASSPAPVEDLPPPPDADDLPTDQLRGVIEALLIVATRPMTVERLAGCVPGTDPAYLEGFLSGLADRWTWEKRGFDLLLIPAANLDRLLQIYAF